METSFICVAKRINWSHHDYWVSDHDPDDDELLEAETIEKLYELIASYKIRNEKHQAPPLPYWSKGSNWHDYSEVKFGAIYEIVRNWDNFDPGESVDPNLILNTKRWQRKLAEEKAAADAKKEADRIKRAEAAERKAQKEEERLERQHRRMKVLERREAKRNNNV